MKQRVGLLHLSLLEGIGPRIIKRVIAQVTEHQVSPYDLTVSELLSWGVAHDKAVAIIEGLSNQRLVEDELRLIEKHAVSFCVVGDADYPHLLAATYAPPLVLYWRGQATWNSTPTLAVVGSREATQYGKRAIDALIAPCVQQGITIISGGARGIDTMAHEVALAAGGSTIAILGSGLLKPYPASNLKLFEKIENQNGAVVSCFPLTTGAQPWQFPVRNRIIAGMATGCLVVQAARESGALITASYALHEGRNVYAVPGHFDDPLSAGCNALLQEGAQMVVEPMALLRDYPSLVQPVEAQTTVFEPKKTVEKQKDLTVKPLPPSGPKTLVDYCGRPISLDQLVELSGKTEIELKNELFMLQLDGIIEQDFAGLWVRK